MKSLSFQILVELKDKISASITKITSSLNQANAIAGEVTNNASRLSSVCERLSQISFATTLQMLDGYSKTLTELTSKGVTFGQSMADLSAITGITGEELKKLEESSRRLGKESGLGASGVADSYKILASNIDVSKIGLDGLNEIQERAITLAQAAGISVGEAAQALAGTINQFGLSADEANRVINVLAAGSKYGAAEIPELAQSFKVVGAAASAAGLTVEQTAGAIEVLSKNNLKGAEAGTALRNIMLKLQTELGIDLGETGLSTALEALKPKLTDVTYLSKLFGMENIAAAQFLITNASAVEEMTNRVTDSSVAQEQAAIRTETNAAKMDRMRAAVDDLKIGFAELAGGLTPWIAVGGENLVMLAQMIPLMSAVKNGVMSVATAENAKRVATLAGVAATKIMSAATATLNAIMSANPIAMVVIAIGAMVAALVYAYNNCESFRVIVDKCWTAVKEFASVVWEYLVKAFEKASSAISSLWNKLKSLFGISNETSAAVDDVSKAISGIDESATTAAPKVNTLLDLLKGLTEEGKYAAGSIGALEDSIKLLRESQKGASIERAAEIEREKRALEDLLNANLALIVLKSYTSGEATVGSLSSGPAFVPIDPSSQYGTAEFETLWKQTLDSVSKSMNKTVDGLSKSLAQSLTFTESIWGKNSVIGDWADSASRNVQRLQSVFIEFSSVLRNKAMSSVEMVGAGMQGVGAIMSEIGGIVGGNTGSWIQYGAAVLASISQAIPAIISMMGLQTASTAVTKADTNAKVANAAAGALSSSAALGPVGWIAGVAGVAGIIAAMASIPKFANGGIVSGPTLAMVGEYPGASNDPEVIAPLSKLRKLIESDGAGSGVAEFRIKGRSLVAVMNKEQSIRSRTR
ncbi:MAG: phage tail tape measure protein [Bacteroidales bacterium]